MNTLLERITISILGAEKPPPLALPSGTGVTETGDLGSFVAGLINWGLGLLGIVFLGLILFAGFQYATAGGDEGKTKEAVGLIRNAIIGILIIGFSFILANTVLTALITNPNAPAATGGATNTTTRGGQTNVPGGSYDACMTRCTQQRGGAACSTAYYRCICGGGGATCNDLR